MGLTERTILRQLRPGDKLPPRIANAPELLMGLDLYVNAFYALTSCRGSSYNSEGPIPWIAMRDYCEDSEIYGEDRFYFYELIAKMDQAYLKYKAEKAKRNQPP